MNNFMSIVFINVTNPGNHNGSRERAFRYLNSYLGQTFPLPKDITVEIIYILQISSTGYRLYLSDTNRAIEGINSTNSNIGNFTDYKPALYQTPFNIISLNFISTSK